MSLRDAYLVEAKCPACGSQNAYQGFSGGWECDNPRCKNHSQKHQQAVSVSPGGPKKVYAVARSGDSTTAFVDAGSPEEAARLFHDWEVSQTGDDDPGEYDVRELVTSVGGVKYVSTYDLKDALEAFEEHLWKPPKRVKVP